MPEIFCICEAAHSASFADFWERMGGDVPAGAIAPGLEFLLLAGFSRTDD